MSSSNRSAMPCEAAIYRGQQAVGPMRLPLEDQASFVEAFNRVYHSLGILIEPVASIRQEDAELPDAQSQP